jgi:hypothetical protein
LTLKDLFARTNKSLEKKATMGVTCVDFHCTLCSQKMQICSTPSCHNKGAFGMCQARQRWRISRKKIRADEVDVKMMSAKPSALFILRAFHISSVVHADDSYFTIAIR